MNKSEWIAASLVYFTTSYTSHQGVAWVQQGIPLFLESPEQTLGFMLELQVTRLRAPFFFSINTNL
jgi:hypothetical protein